MNLIAKDPNTAQSATHRSPDLWAQIQEVCSPLCRIDILVFALILGFGALQFYFSARASDFLGDDVFYFDAARSLIEHGFYGINGYPETNMPPGTSALIALLSVAWGFARAASQCAIVVLGAFGYLACYELLRRQAPRGVAAAICLLLISSRMYFDLATQSVQSCCPYFFASISALLVARELENARQPASRWRWGALLTTLIVASMMFASAGIAFLGGIVATICTNFFRDRRLALSRLRRYAAVLLVGIVVQGLWMHRPVEASAGIGALEWPVSGFPHSYLAQLKVKSGNYPELGIATRRDMAVRVLENASGYSNFLSRMLLRRLPQVAWMSIFVAGPLLLIVLGWSYSVWTTRGGLQEWYFAGYGVIYLLWPWTPELRFFFPIAPLACLYLWRGATALLALTKSKPRLSGIICLPVTSLLAAAAWFWMHGSGTASQFPNAGLEDEFSFAIWSLCAILAAWMVWADTAWLTPIASLLRPTVNVSRISDLRISRLLCTGAVSGLVLLGLTMQIEIVRANLNPNSPANRMPPDAEAGAWIRSHTDANAVVMARQVPTVYHYSKRNVIWFPPSSNPQLLMEGILRNKVKYVLVVRREFEYYFPADDDCFAPLIKAYPDAFRSVYQSPQFRVFQVVRSVPPGGKVSEVPSNARVVMPTPSMVTGG